jgi:hypothetical protein
MDDDDEMIGVLGGRATGYVKLKSSIVSRDPVQLRMTFTIDGHDGLSSVLNGCHGMDTSDFVTPGRPGKIIPHFPTI